VRHPADVVIAVVGVIAVVAGVIGGRAVGGRAGRRGRGGGRRSAARGGGTEEAGGAGAGEDAATHARIGPWIAYACQRLRLARRGTLLDHRRAMASDADLLQRWRAGDGAAGNQLFQRSFAAVYRFFVNKTCNVDDTEELTRSTFVALMSASDRIPASSSLLAYTLGVANGVLGRYFRGLARSNEPFDPLRSSILDLGAGAATGLECTGSQQLLLAALREIPAELQVILELSYVEALDPDAIGEAIGLATAAVRDRLARAREHLRVRVGERAARTDVPVPEPARWPDLIRNAFPTRILSTAGSRDTV
jgi:RNA polymerase sigma-70 factor (ECF subfamily)